MSYIYTVSLLARQWVDRKEDLSLTPKERDRMIYDFEVTGFNIATVGLIITAALTVFANSPLFLVMAGLSYWAQQAFDRELDATPWQMEDPNWQVNFCEFFGFVVWKNSAPANRSDEVVKPLSAKTPVSPSPQQEEPVLPE